jgi:alpha-1,2-mannosyltransferase
MHGPWPRRHSCFSAGSLRSSAALLPAARPVRPVLVTLAVLSAGGALGLAFAEATGHQVDFDIYRMGAGHLLGNQLYEVRLSRALMGGGLGLRFTYPPFAALLFLPFAWLPVRVGQLTWSALNIGFLFALTALSIRAARPQWSPRTACAVAAIALFPVLRLDPNLLTVDLGQINFFVVLLVVADLTCVLRLGSRTIPRGALTGIAAAVKLTPLIFIPFFLLTRQFRAACTAAGTFLLCSIAGFAVAPHSSLLYWSKEVFDDGRSGNLLYISDQNLHSALQRMTGSPPALALVGFLAVLIACGGLFLAAWAYRASSPMLGMLLCAATALIISPISWVHHYVWIGPALAWLVLADDRPRGGRWWALGLAALFWAAPVWWIPDTQSGYGGPLVFLAGNSFFLSAAAFLVLAAMLLVSRRRHELSPAVSVPAWEVTPDHPG